MKSGQNLKMPVSKEKTKKAAGKNRKVWHICFRFKIIRLAKTGEVKEKLHRFCLKKML